MALVTAATPCVASWTAWAFSAFSWSRISWALSLLALSSANCFSVSLMFSASISRLASAEAMAVFAFLTAAKAVSRFSFSAAVFSSHWTSLSSFLASRSEMTVPSRSLILARGSSPLTAAASLDTASKAGLFSSMLLLRSMEAICWDKEVPLGAFLWDSMLCSCKKPARRFLVGASASSAATSARRRASLWSEIGLAAVSTDEEVSKSPESL
mmetsp:Transcript_27689/g.50010  ORF Transcript_27689/g.50010 Transcript_27689/m.50010 type:complete len:212 (-) Transcript_27689:1126-1761(-)